VNHPPPKPVKFGTLKKDGEILEEFRGTGTTKKVTHSGRKRPPIVTTEPQEEEGVAVDPRVKVPATTAARHPPRLVPF
jgi:hypothetical protein